jgi:hypothetical protein
VTIEQLLYHIETEFPAEEEEIELQEALLSEDRDVNNHMDNLFDTMKDGVDTLLVMKAIEGREVNKIFVRYVYRAI